jgi:NAD(P)-dependent dehydrogenase (short-subunit alcohol dehydrogenase family)
MEESMGNCFSEKVAIVTGAASGIGEAVAIDLCKAGATVIAVDLNEEKLHRLYDQMYDNVKIVQANVCSQNDRKRILQVAVEFGGPDFLINAAGILRTMDIFSVTEEMWDEIQNANAKSSFFMCQTIGKYWVDNNKKGAIVNFSSAAGKTSKTLYLAPYNASKASLIAITKSFAYALSPSGSRVNCVCPGIIDTPMQTALIKGISNQSAESEAIVTQKRKDLIPLGRVGTPQEVSKVVEFLLSDSSSYMTGQSINITGGMVMY